jgi:hypothetical protein
MPEMTFLIGRWRGPRPDGRELFLEFLVERQDSILVRMSASGFDGSPPMLRIEEEAGATVLTDLINPPDHDGPFRWYLRRVQSNRLLFGGITWIEWQRRDAETLVQTDFHREGERYRSEVTVLRRLGPS